MQGLDSRFRGNDSLFSRVKEYLTQILKLKSRTALLLAFIGIVIAAALWRWRMSFPFDDAYITFRYAEHFAHGSGIVWNIAGPPTEGYTNFLLVLILSPFAFIHADLLVVSQLIGIVSTILTAVVIFKLVQSIREWEGWSVAASAIYLSLPFTWANAFSGLETSLFVLLVTAAFYYAIRKKWSATFLLASLATLTRPEGTLVGMILALSVYWIDKADRAYAVRALLLYFVMPMALYAGFKFFYFGNLLPNSFYIKTGGPGFHGIPITKDFIRSNAILILCATYALWRYRDRWKKLRPLLLWSGTLVLFYVWPEPLQGFYFRFDWAAMPALIVVVAITIMSEKRHWLSGIVLTLIIGSQIAITLPSVHRDMQLATLEQGRMIYHELGTALKSLPNHERMTFAFQDAGAVPYYSEMNNVDLVGLNTTAIARSQSAIEAYHILDSLQPDIILLPAYHDKGKCWTVFQSGHGKAAMLTQELIQQPMMARYCCVGRIGYLGYDILCYSMPIDTQSVNEALSKHKWFISGSIPCLE